MKDYKDTLNLPVTEFPMKANLSKREPEILQYWEQINLYQKILDNTKSYPSFILHDGPPYANGSIHLGTALNKTLKDIVVKSKILSGFHAPFVPGWDCHGLPIELVVEKKVGKAGVKLSHSEFRKACRDYAKSQVEIQRSDFIRLGVLGDWQHPYLTMDFTYEANIVRALATMVKNGYVRRGFKPVYWCVECGSALAEAEVEYKDKSSPAIDVAFFAVDSAAVLKRFNQSHFTLPVIFPIWTTTPWTLPANQAVALNPALNYVLVKCEWQENIVTFVLAEGLAANVMSRLSISAYEILATLPGEQLKGIQLRHPFLEREVPTVMGEHVTTDAGTGLVHTAPAHGVDDYQVGLANNLPLENPVDARSCFHADVPIVGGMHVFKANELIITTLKNNLHLLHQETLQHSYPHCWRHKTPLIFRSTPQWFINMEHESLRSEAETAITNVKWVPHWGENRISKMVANRPDWCISRQRVWGAPITLFTHKKTGELHPKTVEFMERAAQLIQQEGVDGWFNLDPKSWLGDEAENYEKGTDTLDVWFDSGVSHFCVLEKNSQLHEPADLYLEGSDQHRGWFQTSLLTALTMRELAPFKTVLTHGYVVDGKGYKMSKSIGNTVLPSEVVNALGADLLRLWAAATDHTNDIAYSNEIMKHITEAYRRIRNTARFLLSNLFDFAPEANAVAAHELLALDRYAIEMTAQVQQKIIDAYANFDFPVVYQTIHNFCSIELGSFYLDIIKDRVYTGAKEGLPRRSAQTALFHILEALVRWLAPVLTFTAEEIWRYKPGERNESVFLNTWYEAFPKFSAASNIDWPLIIQVRNAVNKSLEMKRNAGEIGSGLEAEVFLYVEKELQQKLQALQDELRFVFITSAATLLPMSDQDSLSDATEVPGLKIKVVASKHQKCIRCWHRRADVGSDSSHAELCIRCIENAFGHGENRHFA